MERLGYGVGIYRLARVIQASYEIQGIVDRDVTVITRHIHGLEKGLDKNTANMLRLGKTGSPKPATLQKIAPLLFRVHHFRCVNGDPVGVPIFDFQGSYNFERSLQLKLAMSIDDLPDLDYRYTNHWDLTSIIECKTRTKSLFPELLIRR